MANKLPDLAEYMSASSQCVLDCSAAIYISG